MVPVQVDDAGSEVPISSNLFFPNEVVVHPGDTVVFRSVFTGQPHTVTLGTAVDAGLAAGARAASRGVAADPPELAKLTAFARDGWGAISPVVAKPCFLDRGEPPVPTGPPCRQRRQPLFTGRQAFYSSGFLPDGATFTVKLSPAITPGAYGFVSLLQRGMTGQITVVDRSRQLPNPAEVERVKQRRRESVLRGISQAVDEVTATAATAVAGVSGPGGASWANVFRPKDATVAAGEPMTWTVFGLHTISFNPPPNVGPLMVQEGDGWQANRAVVEPTSGRAPPPESLLTPPLGDETESAPTVVDGGTWDGRGFHNSGALASGPSRHTVYRLTFSVPGRYPYTCLIHRGMDGFVSVA